MLELSEKQSVLLITSTGLLGVIFLVNFNLVGVLLTLISIELSIRVIEKHEKGLKSKNLNICSLTTWFFGLGWALWSYWQVCYTSFVRIIQTVI
jgi:hypothetical protein